MNRLTVTLLAAFTTVASVGTAEAQTAGKQARIDSSSRSPLSMDVAGVRLGMPLASAEAVLAGIYRCRREAGYQTFQQLLDLEVAKRRGVVIGFPPQGTGIGDLFCDGPSGESMRVSIAQVASGGVVDKIQLSIPTDRVDQGALVQQVSAKYGRPTTGTAANGAWCIKTCEPLAPMEAGPRIDTSYAKDWFYIHATRGQLARRADEAALKLAAHKAAPQAKRGAF